MELEEEYTLEDLDELERQLEQCLEAYELGQPLISDEEYDHYKRILQKLRPNSKFLDKIGNKPKRNIETLPYVLGSLSNKFEDDIQNWLDKYDNGSGFVLTHKLDGVAIECEYTDGKLTGAWLRGDHYKGENITAKALKFVPNSIRSNDKIYLKGEILLNCEPQAIGYKTKRNAAAGIINRDDYDKLKYLYVLFHTWANPTQSREQKRLIFIQNLFGELCNTTVPYDYVTTKEEVIETAKELFEEETEYDKDGIVITVDNSEVENVKLPEKKIAFKFNKMSVEAEVVSVEWSTSRTGKIIPVVIVKPVVLGGATIQRATGFHAKFIYDNMIGPGAIIKLVRSGDVIPYIDKVIKQSDQCDMIESCPACGQEDLLTDDTHLYCSNLNCPAQTQKRIAYFFEKLGLENFGEKMISSLNCENIIDVYNLKKEDILKIDGWAETSATDFLNRVEQTKKARPEKVLAALGIENLGITTSKLILEHFTPQEIIESLDDEKKLRETVNKLLQISGLGPKKITTIIKGLKENKELLHKLMEIGVSFIPTSGPLSGLSFCITGSLSKPRKAYEQIIEKFGGSNTSINSCNYLICNTPSDSAKFRKAVEKGVKIITEQELIDLIKSKKNSN